MSRWRDVTARVACAALALVAPLACAADYQLGQAIDAKRIAPWNIDVEPDGAGLPAGKGTVAAGARLYDQHCASCHGTFGDDSSYALLAGGIGTLGSSSPVRSVGSRLNFAPTLWDYINRAMPFATPKSLSVDEVYALTAYVLSLNNLLPADGALDEKSLPLVKMPNRNGFTTDHGFLTVSGKPDTHNIRCMRECTTDVRITSEIPESYVRSAYGDLALQMRPLATMNQTGEPEWVMQQAAGSTAPSGANLGGSENGQALMQNAGCIACHAVDQRIVGPSFRDVADKYKGDAGAAEHLLTKIRHGGSGTWGTISMPPQTQVGDADLKAIVAWILAGAISN